MRVEGIIWLRAVIDKLAFKHRVESHEVEELFAAKPNSGLWKTASEKARMSIWLSGKRIAADT
jgi:hypothetical protein